MSRILMLTYTVRAVELEVEDENARPEDFNETREEWIERTAAKRYPGKVVGDVFCSAGRLPPGAEEFVVGHGVSALVPVMRREWPELFGPEESGR